jgi:hypothetical protein
VLVEAPVEAGDVPPLAGPVVVPVAEIGAGLVPLLGDDVEPPGAGSVPERFGI